MAWPTGTSIVAATSRMAAYMRGVNERLDAQGLTLKNFYYSGGQKNYPTAAELAGLAARHTEMKSNMELIRAGLEDLTPNDYPVGYPNRYAQTFAVAATSNIDNSLEYADMLVSHGDVTVPDNIFVKAWWDNVEDWLDALQYFARRLDVGSCDNYAWETPLGGGYGATQQDAWDEMIAAGRSYFSSPSFDDSKTWETYHDGSQYVAYCEEFDNFSMTGCSGYSFPSGYSLGYAFASEQADSNGVFTGGHQFEGQALPVARANIQLKSVSSFPISIDGTNWFPATYKGYQKGWLDFHVTYDISGCVTN